MRTALIIVSTPLGGIAGVLLNLAFWCLLARLTPGPEALGYLYFAYKLTVPAFFVAAIITALVLDWKLPA